MPLFTENIPENHRISLEGEILQSQLFHPLHHFGVISSRQRQPGKISLDVRQKNRDPNTAELLGQDPQGHSLAGAGGPGDKAVAVGHPGQNGNGLL